MHVKIDELKSSLGTVKGLELSIGNIIEKAMAEEVGPTPFPSTVDLREWDFKLLEKYKLSLIHI